jgi:hypothetical protein
MSGKFMTFNSGCGIYLVLPNGYSLSVTWMEGTHSSNYDEHIDLGALNAEDKCRQDAQNAYTAALAAFGEKGAETVEILMRNAQGEAVDMDGYTDVDPEGYCTVAKFAAMLVWALSQTE